MAGGDLEHPGLRLAIVGLGPKGLFALERLLDEVHRSNTPVPIDIDLFEPHSAPGAGPVYDPGQPPYLRMNLAADRLDMWSPESRTVAASARLSFLDWCRSGPDRFEEERYPPRALVGRYLADGFARAREQRPPGVRISIRKHAVAGARRLGSTWTIVAADGAERDYDEILLAVGHRAATDRWDDEPWSHPAPSVAAVYPTEQWLDSDQVPPGATVAVRGFALTFLDAAIAMTEGRGAGFESGGHPYRLSYAPGPDDAGRILPFSRSGRPMLAKPEPHLAAGLPALEEIVQSGSARIHALPEPLDLDADLLPILAWTTAAGLQAARRRRPGRESALQLETAARNWLDSATGGIAPVVPHGPAAELEHSLAVGAGLRPPDLPWALGHTWRGVYPALVARLSGRGLADSAWPAFRRLAAQMERVAFGPPPVNAAKLLALIEAGRIDLTHVRGAELRSAAETTSIQSEHGICAVDAVVDAVLPEPGALRSEGGLVGGLLANGYVRVPAGRRGLEITEEAGCVGRDGRPSTGLAAVGRVTEDWVIGNDTLTRTMHPQTDRWARRVVQRAVRSKVPAIPLEAA